MVKAGHTGQIASHTMFMAQERINVVVSGQEDFPGLEVLEEDADEVIGIEYSRCMLDITKV